MNTIKTHGLTAGSLYKLLYLGSLIPLFLLGLGCGIAAFFGSDTVMFNDHFIYGAQGLIGGIVFGLIFPAIFAAVNWVILVVGLWLWTRFKTIDLKYKE